MLSILETARLLATRHRERAPETFLVMWSPHESEVRLVEVDSEIGTTGEVFPFRFAARPDLDIPYQSVIVLLSPEEWANVKDGRLKLPDGWGDLQEL